MEMKNKLVVVLMVVSAVVLTSLQYQGLAPGIADSGTELISTEIEGDLPSTDPDSSLWDSAGSITVPLSGQILINPTKSTASVDSLEVKSLKNQTHVAFRITWADAVKNDATTKNFEFRDAVAIQVTDKTSLPDVCMGSSGIRMHIMQWKADWQKDIDEGFQDLEDSFPNFWVDYYPLSVGEPPYSLPEAFPGNASLYLAGYHVGNPFSQPLKVTPVEDAEANGYSTITTQETQNAVGRGVWKDGKWSVVISRALDTKDTSDTVIGDVNTLAFAVWDGESNDVGSRKSISNWVTFRTSEIIDVEEKDTGILGLGKLIGIDVCLILIVIIAIFIIAVAMMAKDKNGEGKKGAGKKEEKPEKSEEDTSETPQNENEEKKEIKENKTSGDSKKEVEKGEEKEPGETEKTEEKTEGAKLE